MYSYEWYQWFLIFYAYCFLGWLFESSYVSLSTRQPVNRGFMRGPVLPIYGTGAVMILGVSIPIRDNPLAVYFAGAATATLLEYITGWAMERLFKVRYWDYSKQKFNLNGYICLRSSIAWGFFSLLLVNVIHKPIESFVLAIFPSVAILAACFMSVIFSFDFIHSFKSAWDLGKLLEKFTAVRAELESMQVQLALLKAETSDHFASLREDLEHRAADARYELGGKLDDWKARTEERIPESGLLFQRSSQLLDSLSEDADNFRSDLSAHMKNASERLAQLSFLSRTQREELSASLDSSHSSTAERLLALRTRLVALRERRKNFSAARFTELLRRNPSATSHFAAALEDIRRWNDDNQM